MTRHDFIRHLEHMLQGREDLIDLSDVSLSSFSSPSVLFFGDWTGDTSEALEADILHENYNIYDFLIGTFGMLVEGAEQVVQVDCDVSLEFIMLLDALYGVLCQIDAECDRPERALNVGKLELVLDRGRLQQIEEWNSLIGEGLIATMTPICRSMVRDGVSLLYKAVDILKKDVPFFILCPNLFLSITDGEQVDVYDSFINHDTGWSGLMAWYRMEQCMKKFFPSFSLNIAEGDREQLEDVVKQKLESFIWLKNFVDNLLNDTGRRQYEELIEFYKKLYDLAVTA